MLVKRQVKLSIKRRVGDYCGDELCQIAPINAYTTTMMLLLLHANNVAALSLCFVEADNYQQFDSIMLLSVALAGCVSRGNITDAKGHVIQFLIPRR